MIRSIVLLGTVIALLAAGLVAATLPDRASPGADGSAGSSAGDVARIERIVEAYILQNPEIIPRAIQQLRARERDNERQTLSDRAKRNWAAVTDDAMAPAVGPADAPVTIVEYYDYRCPYCRRAFNYMSEILAARDDVRYIYKQYPILDRGDDSPKISFLASQYALAADRQGRFPAFHRLVMSSEAELTVARLDRFAKEAGLDRDRLEDDLADPELADYVETALDEGRSLGIRATPTFLINADVVRGAVGKARMTAAINRAKRAAD